MQDIVKTIKDSVDIVDLISSYVNLESKAGKFMGLCPFHNESKPSFTVDHEKGFFYCFGCQKGGDLIKFIEFMENMQFNDALDFICEKYDIKVKKKWIKNKKDINYLYKINQIAAQLFFSNLHKSKEGLKAIEYLKKRGIGNSVIEDFTIGYSLDSWNALYTHLSRHFPDSELSATGLFKKNERQYLYDAYRGRIMFPIRDIHNRIIGFGGRIIKDNAKEAKYINSPKTPVFEKGKNLFSIDLARKHISRLNYAVLVEGYLDAVSLFQAGFKNTVACLGTALTEQQVKLLKRYCKKLYICFDSDTAGIKSALSNYDLFQNYELDTFYIDISPSKDPDEFVKEFGEDAFMKRIENASAMEDIVIERYISETTEDKKSLDKSKFMDTVARLLSIKDHIKRYKYFEELASLLNTNSSAIIKEYERAIKAKKTKISQKNKSQNNGFAVSQNEIKILKALLLMTREEITYFQESLYGIIPLNSSIRSLLDYLAPDDQRDIGTVLRDRITYMDPYLSGIIIKTEGELDELSEDGRKELKESIIDKLNNAKLEMLQGQINNARDDETLEKLLKEKIALKRRLLNKGEL